MQNKSKKCPCCYNEELVDFDLQGYSLSRCVHCTHIFTNPIPKSNINFKNDSFEFYGHSPQTTDLDQQIANEKVRLDITLNNLDIQNKLYMLDYACGTGSFVHAARSKGHHAYGTEISKSCLDYAREHFGNFFYSDKEFEGRENKDKLFDLITGFHIAEHIENVDEFFTMLNSLIKPSGYLVLEVPNFFSLNHYLAGDKWYGLAFPYHYQFYSESSMKSLAERNGFELLKTDYSHEESMVSKIHEYLNSLKYSQEMINAELSRYRGLVAVFYLKKNVSLAGKVRSLFR